METISIQRAPELQEPGVVHLHSRAETMKRIEERAQKAAEHLKLTHILNAKTDLPGAIRSYMDATLSGEKLSDAARREYVARHEDQQDQIAASNAFNTVVGSVRRTGTWLRDLLSRFPVADANYACNAKFFEAEPLSAAQWRTLEKHGAAWKKACEIIAAHGADAVRREFESQTPKLKDSLARGEKFAVRTRSEIEHEYQMARSMGKRMKADEFAAVKPLLHAAVRGVVGETIHLGKRIENSERLECRKFGVEYRPSHLPLSIYAAAFFAIANMPTTHMSVNPVDYIRRICGKEAK
jgi:hypothetical protein